MEEFTLPEGFHCYVIRHISAKKVVFFAHANGVSALTYKHFFECLSESLEATVFSYDMRGMGKSQEVEKNLHEANPSWVWELLAMDHIYIFHALQKQFPEDFEKKQLLLMGHSLGAWLSLMTSHRLPHNLPILLDPPVLHWKVSSIWSYAILTGRRHLHLIGQKARKRRKVYDTEKQALDAFKRSTLMSGWDEQALKNYIEATFEKHGEKFYLRHDPLWEATIFESMPMTTLTGLLNIPFFARRKIPYHFIVGEHSDACNADAGWYIRTLLKSAHWFVKSNAKHMFPIEDPKGTVELLCKLKMIR